MKKSFRFAILSFARVIYHRIPLSRAVKWRLRTRLQPVLTCLAGGNTSGISLRSVWAVLFRGKDDSGASVRDFGLEQALAAILRDIAAHAQVYGMPRVWIALPFLASGGAELAALNLCRAVRQLRPEQSVIILVTDKNLVSERMELPPEVLLVVFESYLDEPYSYERKQVLLRDLLVACRPHVFHNINSEVAWYLILAQGERLKHFTQLYASIFAFQFAPDDRTKIGYAAYFLKKGMPHLKGLFSDNQRFLVDAAREYDLSIAERERMIVLYQPCRLLASGTQEDPGVRIAHRHRQLHTPTTCEGRRPQVLWAGRLDAEKRVDLILEIVRRCSFADFRVFGQVVLDDDVPLPSLPNLSYEGPFTSPLEWIDRYDFDAFVFTSRWEGMPNILLEVGALGIPVIAPTVGGVIELVDETTGYPLPERPSAVDYEQTLRRVIASSDEALERAQRLRDLIQRRHSWANFVASVAKVPNYLPPVMAYSQVENDSTEGNRPLVTVIVPCFNQGHYLQQAVASALAACSYSLEIIVVDDGSSDPHIERHLAEAKQMAPGVVRIHRQTNQGLSGARNSGIALARGKYLQFLDADDLLTPGKIDTQIAQLELNQELDVSVCNYLLCDESRRIFTKTEESIARFEMNEQDFLYRWERGFVIPIHCGLFRSEVLHEHRFDTKLRAKEDWLFWTSLSMAGRRFGYINGHWAIYRQHESSMRRSYVSMGRAWLQAGLNIAEMVGEREPLFFESVVAWFERCYRSHPDYRAEIAKLHSTLAGHESRETITKSAKTVEATEQVQLVAEAILNALASLAMCDRPPLITVVVPVYEHFEYLQGCLGSLADQGNVSFEVVCIDDGSPDPRVSSLMENLRDRNPRLLVRREVVNKGISAVQNLAVDMAHGEYVAFLDCDDYLAPGALEAVSATLLARPEIDYLFTDRVDIDERGEPVRIVRYGGYDRLKFTSQDHIAEDLFDGMVASHLKVIRRSVYRALGGCDEQYSGVQDWELALRIAQRHRLYYLDKPLYYHRVHKHSVTRRDNVAQLRKTNMVLRKYLESWRKMASGKQTFHVYCARDLPLPTSHLRVVWKQGGYCVADMRGLANIGQINFLREFNAYFDQIAWSDPQVPSALYGYLCPEVALVREISNASSYRRS